MRSSRNLNINQFTDSYRVPAIISKEEAWRKLEQKIVTREPVVHKTVDLRLYFRITLAAVAVAVVFGVVWFGFLYNRNFSPEISTVLSQVRTCWLPDSSKVQLNSNSAIKYRYNKLNGDRDVVLRGDALFEVKKGKKFQVGFEGGKVMVTGTAFYISAYSTESMRVDCIEGSVSVVLNDTTYTLDKEKGVKIFQGIITGPYQCDKVDVRDRLNGIFSWSRISLPEVTNLIGYRFGYRFILEPALENRYFSGRLDLNKMQEGLTVICMAMNLDFSIDESQKTISLHAK